MDHSQPGSSAHGILQARRLEWVAINFLMWYRSIFLFFFLFASECPIFPRSFDEKTILFHWIASDLLLKINWLYICGSISEHSIEFSSSLCLFFGQYHTVWWLYLHRSLEFREYVSFHFVLFHNCLWKFIFLCKFKNHVVDVYRITCNRCPVKDCWSYMFLLRCMLREWCVRVIWEWGFWSYDVKRSSIRYFY